MKTPSIVIDREWLGDKAKLLKTLEQLYLGREQNYRLYIYLKDLKVVDQIFDQIISQHGIKPVFFEYALRQNQRAAI